MDSISLHGSCQDADRNPQLDFGNHSGLHVSQDLHASPLGSRSKVVDPGRHAENFYASQAKPYVMKHTMPEVIMLAAGLF